MDSIEPVFTTGLEGSPDLPMIGWREWVSLPDLGIAGVKAKIDTGARSSALHTHDYELYETPSGERRVKFHLHPIRRRRWLELECDAPVTATREVKDSGGHVEVRPFITTTVNLGGREWVIDLSLTNRESMRFRMLLGRSALGGQFRIDPSRSYLLGKSLAGAYPKRPS
ncbi:MAG: ATP-dependent zinc protease [Verrucomicrobiae bacterium]|nr:ATP-dependent zinc protease [Verrucomicrobiae bacterium]